MKYKKLEDFLSVVKSKNPNEKEFHQRLQRLLKRSGHF